MKEQMLTTSEAAKILRVHVKTLQRWDRSGELRAERSPSGRRLYKENTIKAQIGLGVSDKNRKIIAYCRVSSQAQKSDLKNQRGAIEQFCLAAAKSNVEYVEEIGGGLNFKRKKFLELFDRVFSGEVEEIILSKPCFSCIIFTTSSKVFSGRCQKFHSQRKILYGKSN